MEELKEKYTRIVIVFTIVIVGAALLMQHVIKSASNPPKEDEALTAYQQAMALQQNAAENKQEHQVVEINKNPENVENADNSYNAPTNNEEEVEKEDYNSLFQKASDEMQKGNYHTAIENFEKSLSYAQGVEITNAKKNLGYCYYEMGNFNSAIPNLKDAEENLYDENEKKDVQTKLVNSYKNINNPEAALVYEEKIYNKTQTKEDFENYARSLMNLNKKDELKNSLEEYLSKNPQDDESMSEFKTWAGMVQEENQENSEPSEDEKTEEQEAN